MALFIVTKRDLDMGFLTAEPTIYDDIGLAEAEAQRLSDRAWEGTYHLLYDVWRTSEIKEPKRPPGVKVVGTHDIGGAG